MLRRKNIRHIKHLSVIPAKAGIHKRHNGTLWELWIPAFAGMTMKNDG